jgi:hypothetical protein
MSKWDENIESSGNLPAFAAMASMDLYGGSGQVGPLGQGGANCGLLLQSGYRVNDLSP